MDKAYITYDEYTDLGGTVSGDAFPKLERKARHWIDYQTFDRIKLLSEVPTVVKEVMVEYIDKLYSFENRSSESESISQYSNGVEKITYRKGTERELSKEMQLTLRTRLPDYLVNRSVNFDVSKYLQSESNDSE